MKAFHKYVDELGIEYAVVPMEVLAITQGMDIGTHRYSYCFDNAGLDAGRDGVYAPTGIKVVKAERNNNGNAVVVESLAPKHLACGVYDFFCIRAVHDDSISDITVGQVFQQGDRWYDEGHNGYATGNHVHFSVAIGKYAGEVKNPAGYLELKNEVPPMDIFFANDTVMKKPIYEWRTYNPMTFAKTPTSTALTKVTTLRYRAAPALTGAVLGILPPFVAYPVLARHTNAVDDWEWAELVVDHKVVYAAICKKDGTSRYLHITEIPAVKLVESPVDVTLTGDGFTVAIKRP